jgi:hypothetical protein
MVKRVPAGAAGQARRAGLAALLVLMPWLAGAAGPPDAGPLPPPLAAETPQAGTTQSGGLPDGGPPSSPGEPATPPAASTAGPSGSDPSALGQVFISGRLDTGLGILSAAAGAGDRSWSALGQAGGRLSVGTDGRAVKPELRLGIATWPEPALSLDRAWVKFRFPGLRGTLGLGKLGWGPGLVLVPGDLLFDSTSPAASLGSDETRPGSAWLGDLWLALGDESFIEALVLSPAAQNQTRAGAGGQTVIVSLPGSLGRLAGGLRLVLGGESLGLELAWAADGRRECQLAALSGQFHLGVDWYLTVREALPFTLPAGWNATGDLDLGAGAFGLFDLGGGISLASRHELLARPGRSWSSVESAHAPAASADNAQAACLAYHDLAFGLPARLGAAVRVFWAPAEPSALVMGEFSWAPLQSLRLYLTASARTGAAGATWQGDAGGAFSLGLGAACTW